MSYRVLLSFTAAVTISISSICDAFGQAPPTVPVGPAGVTIQGHSDAQCAAFTVNPQILLNNMRSFAVKGGFDPANAPEILALQAFIDRFTSGDPADNYNFLSYIQNVDNWEVSIYDPRIPLDSKHPLVWFSSDAADRQTDARYRNHPFFGTPKSVRANSGADADLSKPFVLVLDPRAWFPSLYRDKDGKEFKRAIGLRTNHKYLLRLRLRAKANFKDAIGTFSIGSKDILYEAADDPSNKNASVPKAYHFDSASPESDCFSLTVPLVQPSEIVKSPSYKPNAKPTMLPSPNASTSGDVIVGLSVDLGAMYDSISRDRAGILAHLLEPYSIDTTLNKINITTEMQDSQSTFPFLETMNLNTKDGYRTVNVPLEFGVTTNQMTTNVFPIFGIGIARQFFTAENDQELARKDVKSLPVLQLAVETSGPLKQYGEDPSFFKQSMTRLHLSFGTAGLPLTTDMPHTMSEVIKAKAKSHWLFDFEGDCWLCSNRQVTDVLGPVGKPAEPETNRTLELFGSAGVSYYGFRLGFSSGIVNWQPYARQAGLISLTYTGSL